MLRLSKASSRFSRRAGQQRCRQQQPTPQRAVHALGSGSHAASAKAGGGINTVTFRTELKTPMDTPTGAVTSMRSQMRVNCKDRTAAGVEVVLFEDEAKNRAYARNKAAKIEYLKEPAGSSADLVVKYVCKK